MWLAAFIMLLLYGVIALVMRRILVIGDETNDRSWKVRWNWPEKANERPRQKPRVLIASPQGSEDSDGVEERRQAKTVANLMLL
jgi:hypothetical protein